MILITGACGLIGSHLAKTYESCGNHLLLCDLFDAREKWSNIKDLSNSHFIHYDDLHVALSYYKPKMIFHLAAHTVPTVASYSEFLQNNVGFSRYLLTYSLRNKADFIYASSAATYGDGKIFGFNDNLTLNELKQIRHENIYAWSKHVFDMEAFPYFQNSDSRIVGLKFFNVFGKNEKHKEATNSCSVPYRFTKSIEKNEDVIIFTDPLRRYPEGHQERDFIDVEEASSLVKQLLTTTNVSGLFNIGSGKPTKFIDLFNKVKSQNKLSLSKVNFIEMQEEDALKYQFYTCANMEKLFKIINKG